MIAVLDHVPPDLGLAAIEVAPQIDREPVQGIPVADQKVRSLRRRHSQPRRSSRHRETPGRRSRATHSRSLPGTTRRPTSRPARSARDRSSRPSRRDRSAPRGTRDHRSTATSCPCIPRRRDTAATATPSLAPSPPRASAWPQSTLARDRHGARRAAARRPPGSTSAHRGCSPYMVPMARDRRLPLPPRR